MIFSDREKRFGFENVANGILNNKNEIIVIIDEDGEKSFFKYASDYFENNGLAKEDTAYDEYNVIELQSMSEEDENLFLSYHNLYSSVIVNGVTYFEPRVNSMIIHEQIDDVLNVEIRLGPDGLIQNFDSETETINTGTKLDLDETLIRLNKSAISLINSIKNEELYNDAKNPMLDKLKDIIVEFRHRVYELKDDSFEICDHLSEFEDEKEDEIKADGNFHFTNLDNKNIELKNSNDLLNKGADLYTKGDYKNAFPYYLASALLGNDQAISNLGYCFMYGRSVEKNFDLALACFKIAALKGNPDACYKLATIYRYNEEYKDLKMAKKYYLNAFQNISNSCLYFKYNSLCYNVAKEKISGKIFKKDVNGAYLLLLLAKRGYEEDLEEGFMPHEKHYLDVKKLLDDPIFDITKKNYHEGDEHCYIFSLDPIDFSEFNKTEYFKEYDSVVTLYEVRDPDTGTLIPAGSYGSVLNVGEFHVLLEIKYQEDYHIVEYLKQNVKLIDRSFVNKS